MVPGTSDPWAVYAEVRDDSRRAIQLGTAIGAILAEQHSRIIASDVREWLPAPAWPEPRDWISERLPRVVDDADLVARASDVMEAYESVSVEETDRALVHTDVGFHNLGIDPKSFGVHGIFDYDGAAWADRHHDFRYLVFDLDRYEMLEQRLPSMNRSSVAPSGVTAFSCTTQLALLAIWRTEPAPHRGSARVAEPWRKTFSGRSMRSRRR